MTDFAAILFDMDGTIFDTETLHLKAWVQAASEFGIHSDIEDYVQFVGVREDICYQIFSRQRGAAFPLDAFIQCKTQIAQRLMQQELSYKSGFEALFKHCLDAGLPLGLVTSSSAQIVRQNFAQTAYANDWQVIVTGEDVTQPKPAPDCYLLACSSLGVKPEQTLVFEDSNAGARAAIAAGCKTVMVPDYLPADEEVATHAWKIISCLSQACCYLK